MSNEWEFADITLLLNGLCYLSHRNINKKEIEHVKTYEQFIEDRKDPKYKDGKLPCIVCGAKDAYWEIGDARYYCPGCEEHARLKEDYSIYVKTQQSKGEN